MDAEKIEDIYTLSPTQQGMLFHIMSDPNSRMHFDQKLFTLHGNFHVSVFERSWQQVVDRHPSLRTAFIWENLDQPLQVVYRQVTFPIHIHDWRNLSSAEQEVHLQDYLQADRRRGFQLSEPPLMRLTVIQMAQEIYEIIWSNYHLILDGWSDAILLEEVIALYEAFHQNQSLHLKPSRPYREYISWLKQQDLLEAQNFWRQILQGFRTPISLGVDRKTDSLFSSEDNYSQRHIHLSQATTTALKLLARQHHLTINTIIQGTWALLLSYCSGQEDVVYGTVVSGRPSSLAGVSSMIGLFINTLPVRVLVSPDALLLSWLKELQAKQLQMRQYEYSPLVQVQKWSDVPLGLPLFESILVVLNIADVPYEGDLKIKNFRYITYSSYPLGVNVKPGIELSVDMLYNLDRFETSTITRMLSHFKTLLDNIATQPDVQLNTLVETLKEIDRKQQAVETREHREATVRSLRSFKPKASQLSQGGLVTKDYLQNGSLLPLVIQPGMRDLDLVTWTQSNVEFIEQDLLKHGGILFRNFNVKSVVEFEQFVTVLSGEPLEYRYRASPRTQISRNIYTATDYPATQSIFPHNEHAYSPTFPLKIYFFCVTPAPQGGETPIGDTRKIFERIDPKIRERFTQKKVMYVRNYNDGFGLPWQTVFQTTDKSVVENYCRSHGIQVEWKEENRLRTRQVSPAIFPHPRTGEKVWFNHATFFHVSTLEPTIRKSLLEDFEEEDLPTNTYYGDGSPIESSVLDELRDAYSQEMIVFPWQEGDILLLDNMLAVHGRRPFVGNRKIAVAMAEAFTQDQSRGDTCVV